MNRKAVLKRINNIGLYFPYKLKMIKHIDKKSLDTTKEIKKRLKDKLLPRLKLFKNFYIVFGIGYTTLGIYLYGSKYLPIVVLNLTAIKRACRGSEISMGVGIETTILHELGHAIQNIYELYPDENVAENFAYDYFNYGIINNFWETKLS